jgi:hypothetical protein
MQSTADGCLPAEPFLSRVFLKLVPLAVGGQGLSSYGTLSFVVGRPGGQHHGPELYAPVAIIQVVPEGQQ